MDAPVTENTAKTIQIKWVRSGIGFTRHQKGMVRSLGLLRLNQVVTRPDTPQIRGLVESIPHLVQIVTPPAKPAWMLVPEYTIVPPTEEELAAAREARKKPVKQAKAAPETAGAEKAAEEKPAEDEEVAAVSAKRKKTAKGTAAKAKAAKSGAGKKPKKAEKSSKASKKTRK